MPRKYPKPPHLRQGPLTAAEKGLIDSVVADSPRELDQKQTDALATALRRSPEAMVTAVQAAQQRLVERAERYADIHLEAAEKALESDPDVARKAAEWALSQISAKDDQGRTHRVIESDKSSGSGSGITVQLGIALGGIKQLPASEPSIIDVIEGESE
jgi:hypothetical protein